LAFREYRWTGVSSYRMESSSDRTRTCDPGLMNEQELPRKRKKLQRPPSLDGSPTNCGKRFSRAAAEPAAVAQGRSAADGQPRRAPWHFVRRTHRHPVASVAHGSLRRQRQLLLATVARRGRAGLWPKLHKRLLNRLGKAGGVNLDRVVVDSQSVRALRGRSHRVQPDRPRKTWLQTPRRAARRADHAGQRQRRPTTAHVARRPRRGAARADPDATLAASSATAPTARWR
jgi:hypothetical protein